MQMTIDNIEVNTNVEIPQEEVLAYVVRAKDKYAGRLLSAIDIAIDGEEVDLSYTFRPIKFERTRRITGYLVGTMDRWNNAKQAEEKDRVKHL